MRNNVRFASTTDIGVGRKHVRYGPSADIANLEPVSAVRPKREPAVTLPLHTSLDRIGPRGIGDAAGGVGWQSRAHAFLQLPGLRGGHLGHERPNARRKQTDPPEILEVDEGAGDRDLARFEIDEARVLPQTLQGFDARDLEARRTWRIDPHRPHLALYGRAGQAASDDVPSIGRHRAARFHYSRHLGEPLG